MRLFFSITPQLSVLMDIEKWRQQNWPLLERPINIGNFHLTMAFLGECSTQQLEQLQLTLENYRMPDIDFALDDLGYWPDSAVLWLGCKQSVVALEQVAELCTKTANKAGLRVSGRKFHPHLTLARGVKTPPAAPFFEPEFECTATSLLLQRSFRDRSGARYSTISSW